MSRLDNVHINIQPEGDILKKSFQVDNCLTGVDQLHKQESFIEEAQNALKQGCIYLQGWAANGLNFSDDHVENVLGIKMVLFQR